MRRGLSGITILLIIHRFLSKHFGAIPSCTCYNFFTINYYYNVQSWSQWRAEIPDLRTSGGCDIDPKQIITFKYLKDRKLALCRWEVRIDLNRWQGKH